MGDEPLRLSDDALEVGPARGLGTRLSLVLAVVLAGSAAAQTARTPGLEGAEAAVRAYVDDFASGNAVSAVQRIDPAEVEEFAGLLRSLSDRVGGLEGADVPKGQAPRPRRSRRSSRASSAPTRSASTWARSRAA